MNTLAEKFRLKTKELRLSQQTLAEGICEQSQISKIERGHFIPSADLLFKLSQRRSMKPDVLRIPVYLLTQNAIRLPLAETHQACLPVERRNHSDNKGIEMYE